MSTWAKNIKRSEREKPPLSTYIKSRKMCSMDLFCLTEGVSSLCLAIGRMPPDTSFLVEFYQDEMPPFLLRSFHIFCCEVTCVANL
jgi:hypothetical protein